MEDDRFDGLYLNVADTTRGIEPLLDTVFSFLRRKTDFFSGPAGSADGTQAAIAKVNEVVKKHAELYQSQQLKRQQTAPKSTIRAKKPSISQPKKEEDVIEMSNDAGFDTASLQAETKEEEATKSVPLEATEEPKSVPKQQEAKKKHDDEDDNDDSPPPPGNGGTVDGKYVWTQTLSEVNVSIPVPDNTRGRDLNVVISKKHLKVGLKSKDWIIDAPLTKAVICDECFWTVEDGNRLSINLQKLNQMEWWDSICVGDPTIDVRKIQPENSKISELEGETRQVVEKMMYDQQQKALGLPTSEEQKKWDMLDKFKQQHPELDFSNAKIN